MFSFLNNIPLVTRNILLINVLLFFATILLLSTQQLYIGEYLNAHYLGTPNFQPIQIISHMFMHDHNDIRHIFFNMFILVMFGSFLERIWGPKHFFIFYFSCGIGAFVLDNIVHGFDIFQAKEAMKAAGVDLVSINNLILNKSYLTQTEILNEFNAIVKTKDGENAVMQYWTLCKTNGLGASGATIGLAAAFAFLFPNTELQIMFIPVPIKAKYLIGAYLLYEAYKSFNPSLGDSINHWAHVGGAITAIIIVIARRKFDKTNFY